MVVYICMPKHAHTFFLIPLFCRHYGNFSNFIKSCYNLISLL